MEAKIETKEGIPVVNISGQLEMDKTKPLHQVCLQEFGGKRVVFSLEKLRFVGSSGIKNFLQIFSDLKASQANVKLVGLKPDFQRFIQMLGSPLDFEIHDSVENALSSLQNPGTSMGTIIAPLENTEAFFSEFNSPSDIQPVSTNEN